MMSIGFSLRGLSLVRITKSLPVPAASPISGRLLRSRSPPHPKTVITRPRSSALRQKVPGHRGQIAQGVVGVRVVHDHGEGLPHVDALEAAGDPVKLKSGIRNRTGLNVAGGSRRAAASRL